MFIIFCYLYSVLAFIKLNTTYSEASLYKNLIIFKDDEGIAYSRVTYTTVHNIIDNASNFCLQDKYLATWNEETIRGYVISQKINTNSFNFDEIFSISNVNFTNITISSQYFLALYQNESLYVLDMLTLEQKIIDPMKIESLNQNKAAQIIYRYDEKKAFKNLSTDHQLHVITLSQDVEYLNEQIWFSLEYGNFTTTFWNNGTAFFMNSSAMNYSVPNNELFWYHQDSRLHMKYLFQIQDAHLYAIYTNKGICYQYYGNNYTSPYQNILCMKVTEDYYEIADVNNDYKLQILLKNNKTNELAIDYYNTCLLYQTLQEACSLCLNEECYNECHNLRQYRCSEMYRMRLSLPFVMISLCFGLMLASIAISILKLLKESISFVFKLLCLFTQIIFTTLWKMLTISYRKIQIFFVRIRRRVAILPLQNVEICPICLGEVIAPRYFPCNRHTACLDCYDQYESTFIDTPIKCPYRD